MNEILEISEYDQGNTLIIDALKQNSEIITVLTKKIELLEEDNITLLNNFDVLYEEVNKLKGKDSEWSKNIKKIQRNSNSTPNETNNNVSKAEKIEKIFNYLNEEKKKLAQNNLQKDVEKEKEHLDVDTEKKNKILKEIFNYKKKNEEEKVKDDITIEEDENKKSQNTVRKKRNPLFSRF